MPKGQGYHEPQDIRTKKAPKHQKAALKSKAKDISNAEVKPNRKTWEDFQKLLKEGKIEEAVALQSELKRAEKEEQVSSLENTEQGEKIAVVEIETVFNKVLVYYRIKTSPNGKGFDVWSRREGERWKKITKKDSYYAYQTFDEMIKLVSTSSSELEINRKVISVN